MIGLLISIVNLSASAYLINKGMNGMKNRSEEEIKKERERVAQHQLELMKKRQAEEG